MADTMQIAGKPVKKQTVAIAAGAVVILGIGVYRYRKQAAADAATAADNAAAQAPGTGTDSAIDPATGFPYGSIEDASALTSQSGYITPFGAGGQGTTYLTGGPYPGGGQTPGGFTSNAQWSQAAEDYLVNTASGDANTVGNALGKYITGQVVTAAQSDIVNQAIAFEGYPPVAGANGYPPSIRTAAPVPTPNPNPTPTPTGTANAKPVTGLRVVSKTKTSVTISWSATSAPQGYNYMLKQINGHIVVNAQTTAHQITINGLHSGWEYNFSIHGLPNGVGNAIHVSKLP